MIWCWPLNRMVRVSKVVDRNVAHDGFGATMVAPSTLAMICGDYDVITLFLPARDKVAQSCVDGITIFVYLNGIKAIIMT